MSLASLYADWRCMRDATKDALLREVLHPLSRGGSQSGNGAASKSAFRVLVLDHRATRVVGACLRMFDITQEGIALVESLEKKRQPFPALEAVYIVDPDADSVQRICADFAGSPQYGRAHVFFLRRCADAELALIRQAPQLTQRLSTLTEINLNYLAVEQNVFHLDRPAAMVELFNEGAAGKGACVDAIVGSLVTLCATLHEYPFVRFDAASAVCGTIAADFQRAFNGFVNTSAEFWWRGDGGDGHGDMSQRATLLVLDRAHDPAAPLLHSFTYQALVNDMLNVHDDLCRYFKGPVDQYRGQDQDPALALDPVPDPGSQIGACLLNEDDPLWVDYRHLHVREVIEQLNKDLERYMDTSVARLNREDKAGAGGFGGEASLEDLGRAIVELPEYRELIARHSIHLQLVRLCMKLLGARGLLELALLEQTLLTGVGPDAREVSASSLVAQLMKAVRDPAVGVEDTARLVGLYMVAQRGVKESDRRHILEAADPPLPLEAQTTLLNLAALGVPLALDAAEAKRLAKDPQRKERLAEAKRLASAENADPRARYPMAIPGTVQRLCGNELPATDFPWVIEPPPALLAEQAPASASAAAKPASGGLLKSGFGSSLAAAFGKGRADPAAAPEPPRSLAAAAGGLASKSSLSVRRRPAQQQQQQAQTQQEGGNGVGGDASGNSSSKNNASLAPKPSHAGGTLRDARKRKRSPRGARLIVFVAGGASHAELAALHRVMHESNRDVVVGATHLMGPGAFMHDLRFLERGQAGAFHEELAAMERAKREAAQRRLASEARAAGAQADGADDAEAASEAQGKEQKTRKRGGLFGCGCFGPPPPPASANRPT